MLTTQKIWFCQKTHLTPGTSDGTALGTSSLMWSDLFLASGSVINFNNGDMTMTHSANKVAVAGGALEFEDLSDGTITVTGFVDEDNMASDSATLVPTQQSVKAYVDANVGGNPAADDIATGDAAVTIATTTGNITIDAQASDADIIFKGTDGGVDITALTLDMSEGGAAVFTANILPAADNTVDLGSSSAQFKDAFFHGTVETDAPPIGGTNVNSILVLWLEVPVL